jgi:hypothetical protein
MAGIKVTDLPVLGAAAPDDVIYIVETLTNTSKQIAVEDIVGGIPDIESGAWNPTPTNVIGSPTVTVVNGNYSRVGAVVTCSLFLDVTMGTAENICEFRLDLPIVSNFAQEKNAFGIIAYNNATDGELVNWNIKANTSTDDISIELESVTDEFAYEYIYAILQYIILP